jgi:hypothetical protein
MEGADRKFNISETIRKIREAMSEYDRASERLRLESAPILSDKSLIPIIYGWFCESIKEKVNVERRRQFIFIILYLYSPKSLLGAKMPSGLRHAIIKSIRIGCNSIISDNTKGLLIRYRVYKWWRKDVEQIMSLVTDKLRLGGFLTTEPQENEPKEK